ncbi:MAG TPA: DUF6174 domain-containing protein [Kouleothrix sp.]|uniref:DUF6174 domain-containing protein n=1 Tax=Kouleothrix sp. TaxID=2779161 RepID=UPI002B93640F|nr:DUF6174 domain-containing protein [Kouleothrix sp.]HRC74477.1 DUF6174 domain-containing protein [Kouleothrix sp.]
MRVRQSRALIALGLVLLGAALALLVGWGYGSFQLGGQLQRYRARWAARVPAAYRYTLRVGCFCPPEVTQPVEVTVRDAAVIALVGASSRQPVRGAQLDEAAPIEQLFVLIQRAIDQGADRVDVQYDPEFGYPRAIAIDYMRDASDDEVTYTIEKFEVTP